MQDNTEKYHYCNRCSGQNCRECRNKAGRLNSIGRVDSGSKEKRFTESGYEGVK